MSPGGKVIDLESKRKIMVSNMTMTRKKENSGTDYPSMQTKTKRQRVTSQTYIYVRRNVLS